MKVEIANLILELGDLGKYRIVDDGELGFSVFKDGESEKLFWINSKGEKELFDWLKQKLEK